MLRIFTTAALLALTIGAAQADDLMTAKVTVDYGDLNLSHPMDAKILTDRLQVAAKSVCLSTGHDGSLLQDCMQTAVSDAMTGIESELHKNIRAHMDEKLAMANF